MPIPDMNGQAMPTGAMQQQDPTGDQGLDPLFSKLEDEYRMLNSNLITLQNKGEQMRMQSLKTALEMLKRSGIDVNNPEQIKAFMGRLEQMDPDLLVLFESSMGGLLGNEGPELSGVPAAPEDAGAQDVISAGDQQGPAQQFPNLVQ